MMHAASLTDDALTLELGRLAVRDREATAALIVHLAEFARSMRTLGSYSSWKSREHAVRVEQQV